MKVTLLGTGTSLGVPIIACQCPVCCSTDPRDKRLRSSALVEVGDYTFVIDTGPDFRTQMLRAGVQKIDGVLFTHEHFDHMAGLDDIRAFNLHSKSSIHLYAEKRVLKTIRQGLAYAFGENKYPGTPEIELNEITMEPFSINGVTIIPIRVWHHKMPVMGFRIGDFAYITDAKSIRDEELEKLKGVGVMVINGLRHTPHIAHFSLSEAKEVIEKVKPGQAIITHISHNLGMHAEESQKLPQGIVLGYDGMEINL